MKRLLPLFLYLIGAVGLYAHQVSKDAALQKAKDFMPSFQLKEGVREIRFNSQVGNAPLYIFNNQHDGGFVIVSGNDQTESILGYADHGNLDMDNIPENLRSWLEECAQQINYMDQNGQNEEALTKRVGTTEKAAISPMIEVTWSQGLPYSLKTPTYTNNQGEVTHYTAGCVATAVAQLMSYYRWPKTSQPIPAYTTPSRQIYMPTLPATTFKWDAMQSHYLVSAKDESADAVAELMRYVGQAMRMDYNVSSSMAYVDLTAMANYFGYSKNAYRVSRNDFSTTLWEDMIYGELAEGRPVLYSGQSATASHLFVCDGYDGNGMFHINWGWGGTGNGYFLLSVANPKESEKASSGFVDNQSAIIRLQPARGDEAETPYFNTNVAMMPTASYTRQSAKEDFTDVSTAGCYVRGSFNYDPTTTCEMDLGWALYERGKIGRVIASKHISIDSRSACYYAPQTISLGAGMTDGTYRLVMAYRREDESKWNTTTDQHCLYAEIGENKLTLRAARSDWAYKVNNVSYEGEMMEDTEVKVTINLTNTNDMMHEDAYFWMRQQGEPWEMVAKGIGYYEPGETGDIQLSFVQQTPGTYEVKITADGQGDRVLATSEVTIHGLKKTVFNKIEFACNTNTKEAKVIAGNYISVLLEYAEIPATVNVDGVDYAVTRIDNKAFYNLRFLRKLNLPEGLLYIGDKAFEYCSKLREVHLPSTLQEIGDQAFAYCNSLNTITSNMVVPCDISRDIFMVDEKDGISLEEDEFTSAVLYVPQGSKPKYAANEVWREFTDIVEVNANTAAIGSVKVTNVQQHGPTFSITGQRLSSPHRGINIIDGKKVLLR